MYYNTAFPSFDRYDNAFSMNIKKKLEKTLEERLNGDPNRIDPDVPIEYQTEFLPYDKKWEFSRKRLRFGTFFRSVVRQLILKKKSNYPTMKDNNLDLVVLAKSSKPKPLALWILKL